MFDSQSEAYKWLKNFQPAATSLQETVYLSWLQRVAAFARQREIEDNREFLWNKTRSYFFPRLFLTRSPFYLPDMEKAVNLIASLYQNPNPPTLLLYGDRDADGVTSSTILSQFLVQKFKISPQVLLPLAEEKYGITQEVAERILQYKPDILITLDCGSQNKDTLNFLKEQISHLQIIVIDHHYIPDHLEDYPQVEAFINPKRLPIENSEYDLCTAGLAYKLVQAISYSFTRNYQVPTSLLWQNPQQEADKMIIRNGVLQRKIQSPLRVMSFAANMQTVGVNIPQENFFNGEEFWQKALKNNRALFLYNRFCESCGLPLQPIEKYNILENLGITDLLKHIRPYLSFAAIGTIADLMPLLDDNRILVAEGLALLRNSPSEIPVSLRALFKSVNVRLASVSEQDIGFFVSPAINAAGRLGKSQMALDTLTASDPLEAARNAKKLRSINQERKELSQEAINLVKANLQEEHEKFPVAVVYNENIHRGISGLVATRVAELLQKPAVVLVDDGECLRGSLRSYQSENVFKLLQSVSHLLIQSGGHRQAAGFSLARENLQAFKEAVYQNSLTLALNDEQENFSDSDFSPPIDILDSELKETLWQEVSLFSPYGQMNPHPLLCIKATSDVEVRWMGEKNAHARLNFTANKRESIDAVWFFHPLREQDIQSLKEHAFIAEPHINYFQGRLKFQLKIKSSARADNAS